MPLFFSLFYIDFSRRRSPAGRELHRGIAEQRGHSQKAARGPARDRDHRGRADMSGDGPKVPHRQWHTQHARERGRGRLDTHDSPKSDLKSTQKSSVHQIIHGLSPRLVITHLPQLLPETLHVVNKRAVQTLNLVRSPNRNKSMRQQADLRFSSADSSRKLRAFIYL